MVRLLLKFKAELENVTDLKPADDNFDWFFEVKCTSCNEKHPKYVSMNRVEEKAVSGGKGSTANFVWRCGLCKRESSAKFETASPVQPYTADSSGKLAPLVTLDCRGLEFTNFDPRGVWTCKGTDSGTVFSEVSLDEREWTDYDEKAALPVGILEIESEWVRAP
ncbi:hypothetical protein RhiJN_28366 [Ceratobasidium sp. AG-Ba]|nr:hypothetical protein RhiJN_14315 [Ceratobasidium sp. AG-Ba]QRW00348.1 hypothetical protein RhiJN_28366 [Ceratobasidium sp. AG-Ba]QRW14865.1 hypothetical protein RhiLY_13864 [Ceratobasidium sp. AG-Ba]